MAPENFLLQEKQGTAQGDLRVAGICAWSEKRLE